MMDIDKIKILIADDEEVYTSILDYILKPHYEIYIAHNGEDAIETALDVKPDLILLDVLMPDISGFEVIKFLKNNAITHNIPVILITGLNASEDEEHGFFLGAVDYITKPFNNSIMLARVRTHVQIIKHIRTIEQMGLIDSLTGLPNRRGFDERFALEWERAVREQTPVSLLFMDMDKFKIYNDTYGHPFGDSMLQFVARIYKQCLKRAIDFVSRWGGDEFAILLPGTEGAGACEIAERVQSALNESFITTNCGTNISATVSIGVHSDFPSIENDPFEFIEKTDKALYAAKNLGRNCYYLYNESEIELYSSNITPRVMQANDEILPPVHQVKEKPAASVFMEKIKNAGFLDIDSALASIGGSEELYERIFKMVITNIPDSIKTAEKIIFIDNDLKAFTAKILSIKSSLNQIGYKKLTSLTDVLEAAITEGDESFYREYFDIFKNDLLNFYEKVSDLIFEI